MGFYLFTGCLIWLTQVTNNVNTCTQSIFVTGKCRIRDVLQSVSNQHQIQVEYLSENVNWLPIPVSYPPGWTLTCKPRSVIATCTHDMDISFLFLDSQTIRWNRVCMCWISFFLFICAISSPACRGNCVGFLKATAMDLFVSPVAMWILTWDVFSCTVQQNIVNRR